MSTLHEQLMRPFPLHKLSWRVGATTGDKSKGIGLAYIDARDVMKRLDDVVGPDRWQCRYPLADSGLLICEIGIDYDGSDNWVWKANGAGDTDFEADKGKCSDAFKRAAVLHGIGRYLYGLPNTWVPIEPAGRSYKLPRASIEILMNGLPEWATPDGYDRILAKKVQS